MVETILKTTEQRYQVIERDIGEYKRIKKNGFDFEIHSYEIEGVGYCSLIKMKAMLGLMKMETFVLNPTDKDVPLFSFDLIKVMGNLTLLLEMYDTRIKKEGDFPEIAQIKEEYASLPDHDLGEHWYDYMKLSTSLAKRVKKKYSKEIEELIVKYFDKYLMALDGGESSVKSSKQAISDEYVKGLFANGGPSTDQFIKLIGKEKAEELFGNYVFSTRV